MIGFDGLTARSDNPIQPSWKYDMADQWFYRMFGEDFGPVSFEKLREMADKGTVGADDEVRSEGSDRWMRADSVEGLGLCTNDGGAVVATADNSDTATDLSTTPVGLDDWYCKVLDREMGPLSFEELVKYAEHENLSADDEVRLGANGKWRRVGSIGRLVAVLPYRPVESKTPVPATKSKPATRSKTPAAEQPVVEPHQEESSRPPAPARDESAVQVDLQAAYQAAYEQAKAQIAESMMAQAEAAFKAAEESVKAELAWAFAPNVNPDWWGFMGGVEFGPVGFMQVLALAKNGQLKPSDFVRNGPTGQFFPSSSAPGLYNAVATMGKATEALRLAKEQAQAAAALASPPPAVPPQVLSKPATAVTTPATNSATQTTPRENPGRTQPVEAVVPKRRASDSTPEMSVRTESPRRPIVEQPIDIDLEAELSAMEVKPAVEVKRTKPVAAPVESRPVHTPSPMSGGYSSSISASSSYSTTRPAAAPPPVRPTPRPAPSRGRSSSSSLSDSLAVLKDPKALGAMGVLALVLLFVGWGYLPKSSAADRKHFQALKQIYDEIKSKRASNSNDYLPVMKQADQVSKAVTADLKTKASRDDLGKQSLLWAARDELPRVVTELKKSPATPSKAEEGFATRLWEAANHLGLKDTGLPTPPPPPVIAVSEVRPDGSRDD